MHVSSPRWLDARSMASAFAAGTLSPVDIVRDVLSAIEQHNPAVNAFCFVDANSALAAARASQERWHKGEPLSQLDGVPFTVKDLIHVAGWTTARGSLTSPPTREPAHAPTVARLLEHGAVAIGKTTTPEWGWKAVTDSPGFGITRNPWNHTRTTGGSSGGAAAAAALALGTLHLGTDGGGSIRIPAAFTGIVGLKSTFGRVPAFPLSPFGTIAHVGPMARSVADVTAMLDVISLPDRRDWYALPPASPSIAGETDMKRLRVGAIETDRGGKIDPEVKAAYEASLQALERAGAHITVIRIDLEQARALFDIFWSIGCAHVVATTRPAARQTMDPGLIELAKTAEHLSAADYHRAMVARADFSAEIEALFERVDVIATPTIPILPFEAGNVVPPKSGNKTWSEWTPYTYPFNLGQQPALSLPAGWSKDNLPIGLQLVGPKYGDWQLLQQARAIEALLPRPRTLQEK